MSTKELFWQFRILVILTWLSSPMLGLLFLGYSHILSPEALGALIGSPLTLLFIVATSLIAGVYFHRLASSIEQYLQQPGGSDEASVASRLRSFPYEFWIGYLLCAMAFPALALFVLYQDEILTALPSDWLRYFWSLFSVSLLVGLPVFFRLIDLFGHVAKKLPEAGIQVSVAVKVIAIGIVYPLLVATLIMQYFWAQSGRFNTESFMLWVLLALLIIISGLIFLRSFKQSLAPLRQVIDGPDAIDAQMLTRLVARSTDELGLLAGRLHDYHQIRSQTLVALENSKTELNNILQNMQDTYFRTDATGHITRISTSISRICGYRYDECIGKKMRDRPLGPKVYDLLMEECDLNGGMVHNFESQIERKDGSFGWILANAQYYFDGQGQFAGLEGTLRDITQLKLTEEAMFQEKERLLVTLQSIGDGVVSTDVNGIVDYLNPIAEHLLGCSQQQARGRYYQSVISLVDDATGESLQDLVKLCLEDESSHVHAKEGLLKNPGGDEYNISITVSPMRDSSAHVIGAVLVLHDVTEMMGLARRLSHQAKHDMLTGLVNRREFESRLERALKQAKADEGDHVLMFMDLDKFKIVNDTCGHRAGDALLEQLSNLMQSLVREHDVLGRLGGDEFGLLLENCPIDKARYIAGELLDNIKAFRFNWEDKQFEVGISIGMVPVTAESGHTADLLSAADTACYVAKDQGGHRTHEDIGDNGPVARYKDESAWVHRITEAFESQRFRLYCQGIASTQAIKSEISHYEILLRLVDEFGRVISPMAYFPAAERYNLMPTIDRWVIRNTLKRLRMAQGDKLFPPINVAINLSGQSLCDDDFLNFVIKQFQTTGVPYESVCFEITETAAIGNMRRATEFISTFRSFGCRFALDDFGSGLSSFAYLKNLKVDYLKLDGSYVIDMVYNPLDRAMVESVNQIGHVMGLKTIAEYVETEETVAELIKLKVDYVQGNAIDVPHPLDKILFQ